MQDGNSGRDSFDPALGLFLVCAIFVLVVQFTGL